MADDVKLGIDLVFSSQGIRGFSSRLQKELSTTAKKWTAKVQEETEEAMLVAVNAAIRDGRTEKAWNDFITSPVIAMSRTLRQLIESGAHTEASLLQEQFRQQTALQKHLIEERKGALDDLHKRQLRQTSEQIDSFKTGLQSLGQGVLGGDLGSLVDLLKGGGERIRQRGLAKQQQAKDVGEKSPELASSLGRMGSQLAKFGSSLAIFAALAGSVIMLVKLFMDLESKAKDMNKAVLDATGAADFGFTAAEISGGALASTLETIRSETTAVNDNFMRFRASAKEQQEILNKFNQAGLTFQKMRKDIARGEEAMESFSDVTALALTYSKTLGISTGEATQQMGQFVLDTGLGLRDIAEQFSVITREAMMAGLSTKRFFSTVSEAASGLAFYGVRIEETARLLSTFDTLLGETVGADAFKQLVGRYQDKGAQDRIRELIVKDQEFTQEQFTAAYKRTLQTITRDFGAEIQEKGVNVEELLRSAVSEVDLRKRLADLGIQGAKQQQFLGAYRLRQAVEAGPGPTAAGVAAMPFAGPSFDIALALKSALPLEEFGKSLGEVQETALRTNNQALLVALEQLAETSGKSLDQLIALDNQGRATFERLATVRDTMGEVPEDLRKMGFFIDKQTGEIKRGFFDASDNLVKDNAVAIRNSFDVLSSTPTEGEDTMLEALSRDQQIATEIARNTSSVSDVLEQTIAGILNSIYDVVIVIADFLADDRVKQQKLAAQQAAKQQRDLLTQQARTADANVQELSKRLEQAQQAGDKDQIKQLAMELDAAKQSATTAELTLSRQQAVENAVKNLSDEMVKAEGAGAEAVLSAIERQGEHIFADKADKEGFLKALDAALPRYAESNMEGWEYFKDEFVKNVTAEGVTPEYLAETARKQLQESGITPRIAGGDFAVESAIQRGMEAAAKAENEAGFFASRPEIGRSMAEAFNSAVATSLAQQILPANEQRKQNEDTLTQLKELVDSTKEATSVSGFDIARLMLGQMRRAQDVIIPAHGGPIMTDPRDSIVASRPGGSLDRSRGAPQAPITINIHGGNQKQVHDTVIRALKATGHT